MSYRYQQYLDCIDMSDIECIRVHGARTAERNAAVLSGRAYPYLAHRRAWIVAYLLLRGRWSGIQIGRRLFGKSSERNYQLIMQAMRVAAWVPKMCQCPYHKWTRRWDRVADQISVKDAP